MSPVPRKRECELGHGSPLLPRGVRTAGPPCHREIASPDAIRPPRGGLALGGLAMTAPEQAQRRQLRPSNSSVPRHNGEGLLYANVRSVLIPSGALVIAVSACSKGSLSASPFRG